MHRANGLTHGFEFAAERGDAAAQVALFGGLNFFPRDTLYHPAQQDAQVPEKPNLLASEAGAMSDNGLK